MKKVLLIISILLSNISQAQWVEITSFSANTVRDLQYSNGSFYAASQSGLWQSTDNGSSWINISAGLFGDALKTHEILINNGIIYTAAEDGVFKTTNGGINWENKSTGIQIGPGAARRFCYSITEFNGSLYCGAHAGIYKSTNAGESWTLSGMPGPHSDVEVLYTYQGDLWAGSTNTTIKNLQKTTNNGANWTHMQWFGPNPSAPEVFCFHTAPDSKLFIGTGHGVYFTSNNGANWIERNVGLPLDPYVSSLVQRENTIICSGKFGSRGIYRTTNEGIQWDEISEGLPIVSDTYKLLIVGDTLYLAASDGIYKRLLSEIITNTQFISSEIPVNFTLYQNYPNPFNPSTIIDFAIPRGGHISLDVFDISGRKISSLINEFKNPGSYSVTFDARNIPSGVYFYTLRSSENSITRRMLLVK